MRRVHAHPALVSHARSGTLIGGSLFSTVIVATDGSEELCYVTCGREVYDIEVGGRGARLASVGRAYNCMVGCSTCAVVCPTQAISFPSRDVVWKAEREHKIFKTVRTEARERCDRMAALAARQQAQAEIPQAPTRVRIRIAGVFGEKRFLATLEALITDRPFDIEHLERSVPTLKGLMDNTPAYMTFEITSTAQEPVPSTVDELRRVVAQKKEGIPRIKEFLICAAGAAGL